MESSSMKVFNKGSQPTITEVIIGAGELWTPYRDLRDVIQRALVDSGPESTDELQQMLTIHKPDFISLLTCKGCNAADRQELRNVGGDGAYFKGHEGKQVIPLQLINESFLLSDMFNINEFLAFDLLATAEAELDKHPGWGRGLLAVYLYYEGRNSIVQSVLTVVQNLPGKTWSSTVSPKVVELFRNVFDVAFTGDMMDRLLTNYEKTSEKAAMEMLDSNLALGDWRHRTEVSKLISSIREGLALTIFSWCAQHPMSWKDTLRLLDFLKSHVVTQPEVEVTKGDILILSSVLFCVSNNITMSDVDESFVNGFKKYIKDNESGNGFHNPQLLDFYKLIFYTQAYKVLAETHMNTSRGQVAELSEAKTDWLKAEEGDFDMKTDVFAFLKTYFLLHPSRYCQEEYLMRQYHCLFTDFICFMPVKLSELKNRTEDAAKTATLIYQRGDRRASNLSQEYENFLECLGLFYYNDTLQMARDYYMSKCHWAPLSKFVRSACCDSPTLFIANTKFFVGLAGSCPEGIFNVMKTSGHNMSIEHFFNSMMKYLTSFGIELNYDGLPKQRFETNVKLAMDPQEAGNICSYLEIIETLCRQSDAVKNYFYSQNFQWIKVCFHFGKVRDIPAEIRVRMMKLAAAMIPSKCGNPEVITNLWDVFYQTKFLEQGTADLRTEVEERETRDTVYPMTIAFLELIKSLVDARFPQEDHNILENDFRVVFDNGAFEPYVAYICDSILLRLASRRYKNDMERWTIATLALNIVSSLLDVISSFMFQMLCDSPLLRSCLNILHDCSRVREMSTGAIPYVDACSCQCLSLILRVLQRQSWFLSRRDVLPSKYGSVVVGLNELLTKTVADSGRAEFLLIIVKFIDRHYPELHQYTALKIVSLLILEDFETDSHLYSSVITDTNAGVTFRHTVAQILFDSNCDESLKAVILQLIRSSVVHPAPNVTLFLLGVDKKVDFQDPGVQNYPLTVLHALIDNCVTLQDAFATLLTLVQRPLLWNPLLKYLRNVQFFTKLLSTQFPNSNSSLASIGHFLKVMAVELRTSKHSSSLAVKFLERRNCKFQDILSLLDVENKSPEMPMLEFFDVKQVAKAIKDCEVYDANLKSKIVRIEMLESTLREQIKELEKNVLIMRLRKSITSEAKEVSRFAKCLNAIRTSEAEKMLVFEGWRQCLEVIVLSAAILPAVGMDFVTSILRVLLVKVTSCQAPSRIFLKISAEATVTLCAVISRCKVDLNPKTLNLILNHLCVWVSKEEICGIRSLLYTAILYLVTLFRSEGIAAQGSSLILIMPSVCKDTFQFVELGRMHAMNLVGEILRLTANKGLDVQERSHKYKSALNVLVSATGMAIPSKVTISSTGKDINSGVAPMDLPGSTSVLFLDSTPKLSGNTSFTANLARDTSAPYAQTTILNHIITKGYIQNLVDDLPLVDDKNLLQLFSNQAQNANMKSLYCFESKMGLLTRLGATGSRAATILMDVKIISKLTDMNIFVANPTGFVKSKKLRHNYITSEMNISMEQMTSSGKFLDSGSVTMDSLFAHVLKLFHVMIHSLPKNEFLISEIWMFISTHDLAIGSIICDGSEITPGNLESFLTSLLAKIADRLPANAINKNLLIYQKLMRLLHGYVRKPDLQSYEIRLLRNIMMFLCGHSRNKEAMKENSGDQSLERCGRVILTPSLQLTDFEIATNNEISFGIIMKIVNHAAIRISCMDIDTDPRFGTNLITIIECGLTLIYFHMEIYFTKTISDFSFDPVSKKLKSDMINKAENTARVVSDILKYIPLPGFLDTLILRLRLLQ